MEKIVSRSKDNPLPTRNQILKEFHGRSVEPLYKLKPRGQFSDLRFHENVPQKFYDLYMPLLEETLTAIVVKKKTVDEAVAELQVKGQHVLEQVRAAKKQEEKIKTAK